MLVDFIINNWKNNWFSGILEKFFIIFLMNRNIDIFIISIVLVYNLRNIIIIFVINGLNFGRRILN